MWCNAHSFLQVTFWLYMWQFYLLQYCEEYEWHLSPAWAVQWSICVLCHRAEVGFCNWAPPLSLFTLILGHEDKKFYETSVVDKCSSVNVAMTYGQTEATLFAQISSQCSPPSLISNHFVYKSHYVDCCKSNRIIHLHAVFSLLLWLENYVNWCLCILLYPNATNSSPYVLQNRHRDSAREP